MNYQQKKEILDSESFSLFCINNRSGCGFGCSLSWCRTMGNCSDEFYKIKMEEQDKRINALTATLSCDHDKPYYPTRRDYFAAAIASSNCDLSHKEIVGWADELIKELDKK